VPLIIIADHADDNRERSAEFLALSGFRVVEARDGCEALEMTQALAPDLVVLELSIPKIDGWEIARRLKYDARTRRIPVIAVSSLVLLATGPAGTA
jgi:chemosensory pili system protein ChpA (sensor histidine kinase/response regulator)